MTQARRPTEEELLWITQRAVQEIIPYEDFVSALRSGKRLRLKMGFDPSRPDLHLGHAVGLRKLRQLQDLGHQVVVIVGDWTARIGDPSGQSVTRPMLTEEEVKENAETYLRQFFRVVDKGKTEVRLQSEWFDGFTLADVIRLASRFTVAQMLRRDDFAQRYAQHRPIGIHEFLYPLLQAHDSVAIQSDVEFGGSDQRFNLLVGRELQEMLGQPAQSCFIMPLLVGTDGVQKMSKSLNNYIALEDPAGEMYGKVMSIPDSLIVDYFELATDVPDAEVSEMRQALLSRAVNPMQLKMRLSRDIVAQFHDIESALQAEEDFTRVVRKREIPDDIAEFSISLTKDAFSRGEGPLDGQSGPPHNLSAVIYRAGLASSVAEARRLIRQGAVETAGGTKITDDSLAALTGGCVIRIGKRRFLRILDDGKNRSA